MEPENTQEPATTAVAEPSQEIKKGPKETSEKEKAAFSLKKTAERLQELGGDPTEVLGIKPQYKIDPQVSDETPMTVGTFREIQKQDAKKTALDLAEQIEDEGERTRVKEILTRLAPSGDAHADLKLARGTVNADKNTQIIEEITRKTDTTKHVTSPGAGGKPPEAHFEPSAEEAVMMRPPYNLTKEEIIKARPK